MRITAGGAVAAVAALGFKADTCGAIGVPTEDGCPVAAAMVEGGAGS
jgi:hypothetical protein